MKEAVITILVLTILIGGFVNRSAVKMAEAKKVDSLVDEKTKQYESALDSLKCNVEALGKDL